MKEEFYEIKHGLAELHEFIIKSMSYPNLLDVDHWKFVWTLRGELWNYECLYEIYENV